MTVFRNGLYYRVHKLVHYLFGALLIKISHQPPPILRIYGSHIGNRGLFKFSRLSTSSFGWVLLKLVFSFFHWRLSIQLKATVIIFMVSQQKDSPVQTSLSVCPHSVGRSPVILDPLGMIDIRIPQRRTPTLENLTSHESEHSPYILSHHS